MACRACGDDRGYETELRVDSTGARRKVRSCIACGAADAPQGIESAPQLETVVPAKTSLVVETEPLRTAPSKRGAARRNAQPPEKPQDVVKLAKRRLRDIRRELKRHERLESEAAQLQRMIDAADGGPSMRNMETAERPSTRSVDASASNKR